MVVQKYGIMRGVVVQKMVACGGMAVQKYGSMRTEGCTEIWKHEEGWLYRNMEA